MCFVCVWVSVYVCVFSVAQSCPALCNSMDCSLPGCAVHGVFPGKNIGVGCHFLFQGIFLTQGLNSHLLRLLHGQQILYQLRHPESPNMCLQWNITLPWERRIFCPLWWHGWTLSDYAKWNKSERAGQIVYDLICMWNRKSWIPRNRE